MRETDFLVKWTEELKTEIESLPYNRNDIRKDFFGLLWDIAYSFYKGHLLVELSGLYNKGKLEFKEPIKTSYDRHIVRLATTTEQPIHLQSYRNAINRNLIISAWSNFELCVTTFCNHVLDEETLEKLKKHDYNQVIKYLKNSEISDEDNKKLEKRLIKEHLTHVPITRKTDILFNQVNGYSRVTSDDKEFLVFMGKLRNSMHTNFIYYGRDYDYNYGQAHFKFRNSKLIVWNDPFDGAPRLFFHFLTNLKSIWKEIISCIDHDDIIPYPDEEQE